MISVYFCCNFFSAASSDRVLNQSNDVTILVSSHHFLQRWSRQLVIDDGRDAEAPVHFKSIPDLMSSLALL